MMKVMERLPEMPKEDSVLRVAAYCRVSTDLEKQDSSLDFQKNHYMSMIEDNPCWISAGIFAEKASGLNIKDRRNSKDCFTCADRAWLT